MHYLNLCVVHVCFYGRPDVSTVERWPDVTQLCEYKASSRRLLPYDDTFTQSLTFGTVLVCVKLQIVLINRVEDVI